MSDDGIKSKQHAESVARMNINQLRDTIKNGTLLTAAALAELKKRGQKAE